MQITTQCPVTGNALELLPRLVQQVVWMWCADHQWPFRNGAPNRLCSQSLNGAGCPRACEIPGCMRSLRLVWIVCAVQLPWLWLYALPRGTR